MGITGWLKGYVVISVRGKFPERFVNLCAVRGIKIYRLEEKENAFVMETPVKTFGKMREIARITKCRVRIVKKSGLPFCLKKVTKRKFFLPGALFFFAVVFFLNSFVWTIRIDGNKKITDEEIKIIADYCGLRQGVVKYKVDEKKFSQNALKCEPRLSWIWPEIKGTVCYIHVREKALADPPVDAKKPCDVIAKRSGIINSVTVKKGWAKVTEGESVVEGQMLISSKEEGFAPVHAAGEVLASYWVEVEKTVSSKKTVSTYTGEEKRYYSLVIGNFGMSFRFSGKAPYESYEYSEDENYVKLFGEIYLPVKVKKQEYKEVEKDIVEQSLENVINEAAEEIAEEFENSLGENVVIKQKTVKQEVLSPESAKVTVVFECCEDIALTSYNGQ